MYTTCSIVFKFLCGFRHQNKLFQFLNFGAFQISTKRIVKNLWASFCLFSFFSHDKYSTNIINEKRVDGVLGTPTQDGMRVGADESTELWWHPPTKKVVWHLHLFVFSIFILLLNFWPKVFFHYFFSSQLVADIVTSQTELKELLSRT